MTQAAGRDSHTRPVDRAHRPVRGRAAGRPGREVIKVERPGIGDIARWVGVSVNGMSALYLVCNRGKRSIAVDIHDAGRASTSCAGSWPTPTC